MAQEKIDPVNGIVLVHKSEGMSSHDVVHKLRRIFNIKKIGHFGTLDPFARGLLVIGIGEGVKLSQFLINDDKEYTGAVKFGENTDTYDCTGKITEKFQIKELKREQILEALKSMTGTVMQTPPKYSAIKLNGKPLYKYSREGKEVTPAPRKVTISKIDILDFNGVDTLEIKIVCSKGTYIRSIAYDLGNILGVGGHLSSLLRTRSGSFELKDALSLDNLINQKNVYDIIKPLKDVLDSYSTYYADKQHEEMLRQGKKIILSDLTKINNGTASYIRIVGKNNLIAIGDVEEAITGERSLKTFYFNNIRVFNDY